MQYILPAVCYERARARVCVLARSRPYARSYVGCTVVIGGSEIDRSINQSCVRIITTDNIRMIANCYMMVLVVPI
jgi:hypothetical protein